MCFFLYKVDFVGIVIDIVFKIIIHLACDENVNNYNSIRYDRITQEIVFIIRLINKKHEPPGRLYSLYMIIGFRRSTC